jgi:hypothetical protein
MATVELRDADDQDIEISEPAQPGSTWSENLAKAAAAGALHRTRDGSLIIPLTVSQYLAAIDAGVFAEKAPIELIDGLLFRKDRRDAEGDIMTEGERHYLAKQLLRKKLDALVAPFGLHAVTEPPLVLSDFSLPEPDVAVLRGQLLDYRGRLPTADDAVLVAEVSWSSLRSDQRFKLERYAAANIPNYWIVNLAAKAVEVYSKPDQQNRKYGNVETFDRKATLSLRVTDGELLTIEVADFLFE